MTDAEHRDAAIAALKGTWSGYRVRPHSPRWNTAMTWLPSGRHCRRRRRRHRRRRCSPRDVQPWLGRAGRPLLHRWPRPRRAHYTDAGGHGYDENGPGRGGRTGNDVPA